MRGCLNKCEIVSEQGKALSERKERKTWSHSLASNLTSWRDLSLIGRILVQNLELCLCCAHAIISLHPCSGRSWKPRKLSEKTHVGDSLMKDFHCFLLCVVLNLQRDSCSDQKGSFCCSRKESNLSSQTQDSSGTHAKQKDWCSFQFKTPGHARTHSASFFVACRWETEITPMCTSTRN